MEICVCNVRQENFGLIVEFDCSIGSGLGFWRGSYLPCIGKSYDVEFEINNSIEKGVATFLNSEHRCYIKNIADSLELNGYIESIDDDGICYFRLMPNCLIMIESHMDGFIVGKWLTLRYCFSDIEIYPFGF